MNTGFFKLQPLKELADKGLNSAVLVDIERRAFSIAKEVMPTATEADIAREALNMLPRGVRLLEMYTQTVSTLMTASRRKLELLANEVQLRAQAVERSYVQFLAQKPSNVAEMAKIQGKIADDYADVLDAVKHLENNNVVAVARSPQLQALSSPGDGPLGELFTKAMAIRESRRDASTQFLRQRQAA